MTRFALLALTGCATALAGGDAPPTSGSVTRGADPKPDAGDVTAIKDAAAKFKKWGRVDEQARAAPTNCASPRSVDGEPAHARVSQADGGPHTRKLYFLWASDRAAYLDHRDAPVGFAIVKQSFSTRELARKPTPTSNSADNIPAPIDWIEDGGKILGADKPKDLFVMVKVGGDGADAGWIYGTVAPDGAVTSAGRVASCMACHASATHERLFGLSASPRARSAP